MRRAVFSGLNAEKYDRQYGDRALLGRIGGYFRPFRRRMLLIALTVTLDSLANTASPVLLAKAVDIVAERPSPANLLLLPLAILLLGIFGWVANYLRQLYTARVVGDVVLQLRTDVFKAAIAHDLSFYDTFSSGRVVSRITSDTHDFTETVNLALNLLSQVMLFILLSIWLLGINVGLTFFLLIMTPIPMLLAVSFRRLARRVTQRYRRITAVINAQIQESISGLLVAKNFRQEGAIYRRFAGYNAQGYQQGLRRGLTMASIFPVIELAAGFAVATLFYAGGLATRPGSWLASLGSVTPGEWYLYMQAVRYYWRPMSQIAAFWSQFQDGLSAAERIFALIDAEPKVVQTATEAVGRLAGRITFTGVQFSYTGTEVVLPDFSLDIAAGETVALVGHTGSGKSSVARLIGRFYEFQGGAITIDGRDIRSLDLAGYRRQVGLVPQTPFLFSGTVGDNIRYGQPQADEEAILAAARKISGGQWLRALANGLATDVGERGNNLSMGQRQLVTLTRVLVQDPAILILDEATASVDPFTEAQIQAGLNEVMTDRTTVVIAHRLSTVRRADRILVLDHGRIVESGSHQDLMTQGGHYATLYDTYFRHQSLAYVEGFADRSG